jgi:hypothetical protein
MDPETLEKREKVLGKGHSDKLDKLVLSRIPLSLAEAIQFGVGTLRKGVRWVQESTQTTASFYSCVLRSLLKDGKGNRSIYEVILCRNIDSQSTFAKFLD